MTATQDTTRISLHQIQGSLERSDHVLNRQVSGLTQADSLLQPQPRGNCLNWVVGHIALHREYMLAILAQEPVLGAEALSRYVRGSEPIVGEGEGVLELPDLLTALAAQKERVTAALESASAESLAQPSQDDPSVTSAEQLEVLAWHETYHVGLTELLRQLSGVNDTVIP